MATRKNPPTLQDSTHDAAVVDLGEETGDFAEATLRMEPYRGKPRGASSSQMQSIAAVMPQSGEQAAEPVRPFKREITASTENVRAKKKSEPRVVSGLLSIGTAGTNDDANAPTDEVKAAPDRGAGFMDILDRLTVVCADLEKSEDVRAPWLREQLQALLERMGVRAL